MPINSINMQKANNIAFYLLLISALCIIGLPQYYVTADGASHVYNSKVFANYVLNKHTSFYKTFYSLNRSLDPNISTTLLLALFTKLLPAWLADKCVQLFAITILVLGIKKINNLQSADNNFYLLFYSLVFTLTFQMGFYNYTLALGILLWLIYFSFKLINNSNVTNVLPIAIGAVLIMLTHGMVGTLYLVWLATYLFTASFTAINTFKQKLSVFLSIALAPTLLLISFILKQGLATTPHPLSYWQKFILFIKHFSGVSTVSTEANFALAFIIILLFLSFLVLVFYKAKHSLSISFIVLIVFTMLQYFTAPATLAYAGGTDIRTAFLPLLFMLLFLGKYTLSHNFQMAIISLSVLLQGLFINSRVANVWAASTETKAINKMANKLNPNSTLLQIQYNQHGANFSMQADNSFMHVADWLGTHPNKPIIILNNYEPNTNYFALLWRPNFNPLSYFKNLLDNKVYNYTEIINYEKGTHQPINYIYWQDSLEPQNYLAKINLLDSIEIFYNKIDSIPNLGIQLFQKK
jgi:hypothetical protein